MPPLSQSRPTQRLHRRPRRFGRIRGKVTDALRRPNGRLPFRRQRPLDRPDRPGFGVADIPPEFPQVPAHLGRPPQIGTGPFAAGPRRTGP